MIHTRFLKFKRKDIRRIYSWMCKYEFNQMINEENLKKERKKKHNKDYQNTIHLPSNWNILLFLEFSSLRWESKVNLESICLDLPQNLFFFCYTEIPNGRTWLELLSLKFSLKLFFCFRYKIWNGDVILCLCNFYENNWRNLMSPLFIYFKIQ